MKMLGRGFLLVAVLSQALWADPAAGDLRTSKAYLREVKNHLLHSFIDSDRVKEEDLVVAGLKAMAAAMDGRSFRGLDPLERGAVRSAILDEASLEDALAAAQRTASGIDLIELADHAARAMVASIGDPYSRLFTDEEMNRLAQMLQGKGRSESSGLMLENRSGRVRVAYVQYGYPGYQEGIEIGDEILEIRGRPVSEVRPEEFSELCRLPAGDALELRVRRDGREYPFRIPARKTAVRDVRFEYLGQGVGYLRLTIFDLNLVSEVHSALKELKQQGMKGLILDLRHNPGGALPAATGVADLFLPQGLQITRTVTHYRPSVVGFRLPGLGNAEDFVTKVRTDFEEMPMVCLINHASASASELLSGALKDHHRALMIGETTYGKGVGQTPILLSSMLMKRYLYLTVMRYTTPNGTPVDHQGVAPDLAVPDSRPSADLFDAQWKLRRTGKVEAYRDEHWGPRLEALADQDGFETGRYEGFDAFYAGLGTPLTRDQVREEIRRSIRRRMEDEGTVWATDLETDRVLQKGLVELLSRLGK